LKQPTTVFILATDICLVGKRTLKLCLPWFLGQRNNSRKAQGAKVSIALASIAGVFCQQKCREPCQCNGSLTCWSNFTLSQCVFKTEK